MAYERSIYSDMYSPNNMFGVTNTNAANNLNTQTAFRPNSFLDNRIKMMQGLQDQGFDQPNLPALKQRDWNQFQKKQIPLSLDKNLYKDVEGYTADAGNVMNDANILQPDFSQVNKMSMIPEGFIDKMKSLYGGIRNTDAAQTMNTGNKYANLADDAWANKQTIRTPGGEIVVDTESGQVAPDIASFSGEEEETVTDPDWDRHMRMINSESAEEEGILAPNKWQQFLSKYTRQPYRGAQRHTRDFTPAQLNRMNALGGQYSEPLRQQRRERSRVADLLARQAAEKSYSQANLNKLTMGSRPGHYDRPGGDQTVRGTSSPASPGGWHPGVAAGGIIGAF